MLHQCGRPVDVVLADIGFALEHGEGAGQPGDVFRCLGCQRSHRGQFSILAQGVLDVVIERHPGALGGWRQADLGWIEFVVVLQQGPGALQQISQPVSVATVFRGVAKVDGRLIIFLDLDRIFSVEEQEALYQSVE